MATKTVRISKEYLEVVKLWGNYFRLTESQAVRMFICMGLLFIEKGTDIVNAAPKLKQLAENRLLLAELFEDATKVLEGSDNGQEFDSLLTELAELSR